MKMRIKIKGGPGSGNYGHAGRPGLVGGSSTAGGALYVGIPDSVLACTGTDWALRAKDKCKTSILMNVEYRNANRSAGEQERSFDAYIEEANSNLLNVLDESRVAIRVTEETLVMILEDGKIKTQHETGTSGGEYDPKLRGEFERDVMGLSGGEEPPVYGFITQRDDGRLGTVYLDQYGNVAVYLRDDTVRDRTTFTNCDSLDTSGYLTENPRLFPSPIMDPSIYSMFETSQRMDVLGVTEDFGKLWPKGSGPDSGTYWEAQVHGGVQVSDIDRIVFAEQPSIAATTLLESRGISWSIKE